MSLSKYTLKKIIKNSPTCSNRETSNQYTNDITTLNNFLEHILQFNTFEYFFFSEKNCYDLHKHFPQNKTFKHCVFVLPYLYHSFFNLFKNNIYQDCTIFISNSNLYMANLNPESSSILKSLEKKNFIIVTTYITELCKFYNNNLDDAPYYLIKGINISHEDLSNVKLPNNKSFFQDLYFSNIFNCSLPPIDPSIYDLSNITFDSVSFHPDTMFSKLITSANFIYCEFPSLDFTSLDSDKKINLSYCKIGEGSTFPNDVDFFIRNNFHSCSLPNYDYSHYNLTNNFLTISAFSSESILPLERYGSKKFNIMNNMRYIPTRYLSEYIQLCTIPDPRIFLLKYYENLSEDDLFIFYQKYIL